MLDATKIQNFSERKNFYGKKLNPASLAERKQRLFVRIKLFNIVAVSALWLRLPMHFLLERANVPKRFLVLWCADDGRKGFYIFIYYILYYNIIYNI
jgi:hypothetical protein